MQETVPTPLERCAEPGCRKSFRPQRRWQKYHHSSCRKRHWRQRREPPPGVALRCPHCRQPVALTLAPTLSPPKPSS